MFITRAIVTVIAAPLLLGAVWIGFPVFHTVVGLSAAIIAWEWEKLCRGSHSFRGALIGSTALVCVLISDFRPDLALWISCGLFLMMLGIETVSKGVRSSVMPLGALYVLVPAISLIFLLREAGPLMVMWLLVVIWGTDTGGYLFGKLIGGPKMAPHISPNKTWAGFAGALVLAEIFSAIFFAITAALPMFALAPAAACLSLCAQAGDLVESRMKRNAGVKDSGTFLPGHGGLMDRFDGLWAAAPILAGIVIVTGLGIPG